VHDRVDTRPADHLGDQRVADVGTDELGATHAAQQVPRRRHGVDAEHPFDVRIGGEPGGEVPAEETAHAGD
jgi:hypothetical protein